MERAGSHCANETISSPESDEAAHLTRTPVACRSHEGETPERCRRDASRQRPLSRYKEAI